MERKQLAVNETRWKAIRRAVVLAAEGSTAEMRDAAWAELGKLMAGWWASSRKDGKEVHAIWSALCAMAARDIADGWPAVVDAAYDEVERAAREEEAKLAAALAVVGTRKRRKGGGEVKK